MPSGLRLEISLVSPWFDIHVFMPPVYHGKTSSNSMCGNSNGNANDDLQNADNPNYFRFVLNYLRFVLNYFTLF